MKKEEITLNNENIEKKDNSKTFTQEEVNEMLKEKEKEVKKAEAESLKKAKENKKYTKIEIDEIIKNYMKGKVN